MKYLFYYKRKVKMDEYKMVNKIAIDFKNIISELETNNLKLCFVGNRGLFVEDSQNNLYQMETYYIGSYLDNLIKNGIVVEFNRVDDILSRNIKNWEKEIWNISEVKNFIKRQSL